MTTAAADKTNITAAKWDAAFIDDLPDSSFAFILPGGSKDSGGKTTPRANRKLPYKDVSGNVDMPHLRNALSRLTQTEGVPATEVDAIKTKLESALKKNNPEASRSYSAIHADASTNELPTKIMLLRSGTYQTSKYGEMSLTADDLKEMADNFSKGIGLNDDGSTGAPINFGHDIGGAAAAWIKGLVVEADGDGVALYASPVDWTVAGQEAVQGGMYKYVSSEFWPRCMAEWTDYENSGLAAQNVFEGAALTNIPMFTGLKPVAASASSAIMQGNAPLNIVFIKANNNKESQMPTLEEVRVKENDALSEDDRKILTDNKASLTADELKKFGFEPATAEGAGATGEENNEEVVDGGEAGASASRGTMVSIEASRLKALEATASSYESEKAETLVKAHVERGAVKADAIGRWTARLLAASTEERTALEADLKDLPNNEILASEQGSSATADDTNTAWEKVSEKAHKIVADSKGSTKFEDAVKSVIHSDKTLAEALNTEREQE